MNPRCFQIKSQDNVATLIDDAPAGPVEIIGAGRRQTAAGEPIARGHKMALADIAAGSAVIKFGARIGHATQAINSGAWVHLHNLASDLDERSATLDLRSGAPTDTASAYV
ncbi:MAG TPA: UxaA family hydrolase [Candidatus Acidoferrum sp.]|nr:UxaA family hydrolase [Candidatus Acidoferrum sp.]